MDFATPIDRLIHLNGAFYAIGLEGDSFSFTTAPLTLAAPTGLQAVSGPTTVTLAWNPVPNAAGYAVYRQNLGPLSFYNNTNQSVIEYIGRTDVPLYSDNVMLGFRWPMQYLIRAIDASGVEGEPTDPLKVACYPLLNANLLTQMDADAAWSLEFKWNNDLAYHPPLDAAPIWNGGFGNDIPTGWAKHSLLGNCYYVNYPWIYSEELGWCAYYSGDSPGDDVFLWFPADGWLYTWRGGFAFLWSFDHANWIWVDSGEGHTRNWYLHQGDDTWVQIPR